MASLTRAKIRGFIIYANWNAYRLIESDELIVAKGLYPVREGRVLYLPFLFEGVVIKVEL